MTCLHNRHIKPIIFNALTKDSFALESYVARGGYSALKKVLFNKSTPQQIIDEIQVAQLKGRGGAAFPTATKWSFMPKTRTQKYLICNGDESEPGTFKDKDILYYNPHCVIEGMLLTMYALSIPTAYIYIHGEIFEVYQRFEKALQQARDARLIGESVLDSSFSAQIYAFHGAGAYVCGEETALIESIEGKRGMPRFKPPYPAQIGLFGQPTLINNVETLAYIPFILNMGGKAFAGLGENGAAGVKIFSVSGDVTYPGNYEVPLGTSLEQLLACAGGIKNERRLKAIIPGGVSSPVVPAFLAKDLVLDYNALVKVGSMIGSGGLIVIDETRSMVKVLLNIIRFFSHESCGQCTPCREGVSWMCSLLEKIDKQQAKKDDLDQLINVAMQIRGKTICALGESAANAVLSTLYYFREEFERALSKVKA